MESVYMVVAVAGGLGALFFGARCVYMILYGIAEARGYPMSPVQAGLVTALIDSDRSGPADWRHFGLGRCWAGHPLTSPSHTNGDNCLSGAAPE